MREGLLEIKRDLKEIITKCNVNTSYGCQFEQTICKKTLGDN